MTEKTLLVSGGRALKIIARLVELVDKDIHYVGIAIATAWKMHLPMATYIECQY